jgi:hypothetical protein
MMTYTRTTRHILMVFMLLSITSCCHVHAESNTLNILEESDSTVAVRLSEGTGPQAGPRARQGTAPEDFALLQTQTEQMHASLLSNNIMRDVLHLMDSDRAESTVTVTESILKKGIIPESVPMTIVDRYSIALGIPKQYRCRCHIYFDMTVPMVRCRCLNSEKIQKV